MLKRHRAIISLGLLILTLMLLGCHTVPLGDPEKSAADASLAGWWLDDKSEKRLLVYMTPYDSRTYLAVAYSYTAKGDAIKPDIKFTNKAWMTKVGGMDVMCFEIIDPEWEVEENETTAQRYTYYRIRKPAPGVLEATPLNIDFLKDTKTPEELAKKIADNVNNPELWKDVQPQILTLVPASGKEELKKILTAFQPAKGE